MRPDALDPTARWTRQIANLRSRIQRRRASGGASGELIEAALVACEGLLQDLAGEHLECDRLRNEVRTETAAWEHLFDAMPGGCLLTDDAGFIRNANNAAAAILNTSARHLKDRQLLVFSEDRGPFRALLERLARGSEHVRATIALRPRERKPTVVDVIAIRLTADEAGGVVWFLSPTTDSRNVSRAESVGEAAISASDR